MRPMSRVLLPALALSLAIPAAAVAQVCLGNASFTTNHLQVNAGYTANNDFEDLDASFVWGSNSAFAGLGVGSFLLDDGNPSTRITGALGYQVPLTSGGGLQACPMLRAAYGLPRSNYLGLGGDLSTQSYGLGLAVGGTLLRAERLAIVPSLQATVQRDVFIVSGSPAPDDRSDTYATAGLAVGFVMNNALSLRPHISMPINAAFDEIIFGLGLSLNFGGRR